MRVGCQLICVSVIVLSWEECAAVDSSDSPVSRCASAVSEWARRHFQHVLVCRDPLPVKTVVSTVAGSR